MISRMFVESGDTVILEEFCYAGAITEMQPEIRVATQTLPFASTASESNIW